MTLKTIRGIFSYASLFFSLGCMKGRRLKVPQLSKFLLALGGCFRPTRKTAVDAFGPIASFLHPSFSTTPTVVKRQPAFSNMLLRVRSNIGTSKCNVDPSDRISDVVARIQSGNDDTSTSLKRTMLQQLSRNPAGTDVLALDQTLEELGISHGTMLYCRLEETSPSNATTTVTRADPGVNHVALAPQQDKVIDLFNSSSDEDESKILRSSGKSSPAVNPKKRQRKSHSRLDSAPTTDGSSSSLVGKKSRAMKSPLSSSHPANFQIASYNVWFGPPDPSANQVHPRERMAAIAHELQSCQNDLLLVGFQELTSSLREYLEPHLKRMGYRFCTQPLGGAYGVGLAISKQISMVESKFLPFDDSAQGRGLLYVQTPTMLFGTTHLESFLDAKTYNGAAQRERQIVQATKFCQERLRQNPNLQLAMIAGDFNWDDERKQKGTSPNSPLIELLESDCGVAWKDAGTPFDYTYDGRENPMLGGNLRRRFDRCIYLTRSSTSTTTTVQLQKLGMTAIPALTWNKKNFFNGTSKQVPVAPSDHFGIAVTFYSI